MATYRFSSPGNIPNPTPGRTLDEYTPRRNWSAIYTVRARTIKQLKSKSARQSNCLTCKKNRSRSVQRCFRVKADAAEAAKPPKRGRGRPLSQPPTAKRALESQASAASAAGPSQASASAAGPSQASASAAGPSQASASAAGPSQAAASAKKKSNSLIYFLVTDVTSLYQTLRFLGLDQTMIHLCKTNR